MGDSLMPANADLATPTVEGTLVPANLDDLPIGSNMLDRKSIVRKANDIATAQISLSTWSFRILDAALAVYSRQRTPIVSFHLKDVLRILDSKSNRPYELAMEIAEDLMTNFIRVEHKSRNNRSTFEAQSLVDNCRYDSGVFTVRFSAPGLKLLNEDRNYTSYLYLYGNKHDALKNAFFQVIAANAYTGKYTDPVDLFRQRMNIPDDKWLSYGHLKERAIKPAIKAVNDSGLFSVTLSKEVKVKLKVVSLEFTITDLRKYGDTGLPNGGQQEMDIVLSDKAIIQMLMVAGYDSGAHDVKIIQMIKAQAERVGISVADYIQSNLEYVQSTIEKNSQRAKPKEISGGYIVEALKSDYGKRSRANKARELEERQAEAAIKQADIDFKKLKEDHALLFNDLPSLIRECTPKQRESILELVKENLKVFPRVSKALKSVDSLDHPLFEDDVTAQAIMREFVKQALQEAKPTKFPDLKTYAHSRSVSDLVLDRVEQES